MHFSTQKNDIEQSIAGDKAAFGRLVDKNAAMVTGVAYSVCGDVAASEDIGQEAFTEAWLKLSTLHSPEKFSAWLCTIARRKAIDWLRRRKPSQALESVAGGIFDSKTQTAEANMISMQHQQLVWSLLEQLPQNYRDAMVLYYRGQQSTREVADALDTTEANVRQRLQRGREMIRHEMDDTIRVALCESAPQPAFSAAVVASLPALTAAAAKSLTTAGATTIATKSASLATGPAIGLAGAILGPLLGIAGGVFGTWNSWRNCEYESQQKLIVRSSLVFVVGLAVFLGLLACLISMRLNGLIVDNFIYGGLLIGLIAGFQIVNLVWMAWGIRGYKKAAERAREAGEPIRKPTTTRP